MKNKDQSASNQPDMFQDYMKLITYTSSTMHVVTQNYFLYKFRNFSKPLLSLNEIWVKEKKIEENTEKVY